MNFPLSPSHFNFYHFCSSPFSFFIIFHSPHPLILHFPPAALPPSDGRSGVERFTRTCPGLPAIQPAVLRMLALSRPHVFTRVVPHAETNPLPVMAAATNGDVSPEPN